MRQYFLNKTWAYFIPLGLLLAYSLYRSIHFRIHDFVNYYYGAKHALSASWSNKIYNADYFNDWISDQFGVDSFASYFPNPPSLSFLYAPVGLLDPISAKLLVNLLGIAMLLTVLYHLTKREQLELWSLCLLPLIFLMSIKNNILFGQSYLILLGLVYFGYYALKSNRLSAALLAWPLAVFLKSSPIVLLIIPILSKKFSAFIKLSLVLVALFLLSLIWIPFLDWLYYFAEIMPAVSQGDLYNGFSHQSKSWMMIFKLLMVKEPLLNPDPLISDTRLFYAANLFFKFFILTAVVVITYREKVLDLKLLALWLIALLLMSPTLSSYSMILLLPAYFVMMQQFKSLPSYLGLALLCLICYYPSHWFSSQFIYLSFGRALLLLGFFLLFLRSQFNSNWNFTLKAAFTGAVVIAVLSYLLSKSYELPNDYFLTSEPHIMMVDFELNDKDVIASYKTRNGIEQILTPHGLKIDSQKQLEQMRNAHVKNSILVNDSLLIYMTDLNRSPGFYTLRKKPWNQIN